VTGERPAASITACPDGPLLVRGNFELVSAAGDAVPRPRRTVALCRCGYSALKPFCDGSHKAAGFTTDDQE
jgi:CDGSH-type Zn-finger protein